MAAPSSSPNIVGDVLSRCTASGPPARAILLGFACDIGSADVSGWFGSPTCQGLENQAAFEAILGFVLRGSCWPACSVPRRPTAELLRPRLGSGSGPGEEALAAASLTRRPPSVSQYDHRRLPHRGALRRHHGRGVPQPRHHRLRGMQDLWSCCRPSPIGGGHLSKPENRGHGLPVDGVNVGAWTANRNRAHRVVAPHARRARRCRPNVVAPEDVTEVERPRPGCSVRIHDPPAGR